MHIKGFADDAALIVTGPDLPSMVDLMQVSINRAIEWGRENGLRFGAAKTVSVIFSRRIFEEPRRLIVDETEIQYSDTVRYLGVTLDSRLDFGNHVSDKLKKAKSLLFQLRNGVGRLWGPSVGHMR